MTFPHEQLYSHRQLPRRTSQGALLYHGACFTDGGVALFQIQSIRRYYFR
jgi:hypothetical protein